MMYLYVCVFNAGHLKVMKKKGENWYHETGCLGAWECARKPVKRKIKERTVDIYIMYIHIFIHVYVYIYIHVYARMPMYCCILWVSLSFYDVVCVCVCSNADMKVRMCMLLRYCRNFYSHFTVFLSFQILLFATPVRNAAPFFFAAVVFIIIGLL